VEVAGNEPACFSVSTGLLRAQPVWCFGPLVFTGTGEEPYSAEVSSAAR